jgi:hypothetical protein
MNFFTQINFLVRWIRSAIAYRHGGDMVVGDYAGPAGYQPRAFDDNTQVISLGEQALDESMKDDPDPQIAPGVK